MVSSGFWLAVRLAFATQGRLDLWCRTARPLGLLLRRERFLQEALLLGHIERHRHKAKGRNSQIRFANVPAQAGQDEQPACSSAAPAGPDQPGW